MDSKPIDPDSIRKAVRDVYDSGGYQEDLPTPPVKESVEGWGWLGDLLTAGTTLFWVFIAVCAVGLLAWIVVRLIDRYGASIEQRDLDEALEVADVTISTRPAQEAAGLATHGDFAGAIHVLLLATIDELQDTLRYEASPAFTSREILRDCPLRDDSAAALSELIRRVELHYFGTRPPQREDYEYCVAQFAAFRDTCTSAPPRGRSS